MRAGPGIKIRQRNAIRLKKLNARTPEAKLINDLIDEVNRLNDMVISADVKTQAAGGDTGVWLP